MVNEELAKQIAKSAKALAEPIDFEALIRDGVLVKKGRSYYVKNINLLPDHARQKIKEVTSTKDGIRIVFCKETKSIKKLADQFSDYID